MAPLRPLVLASWLACACALDNGRSVTPPMGWRSWNLYGERVEQSLIEAQMEAITDRSRTVFGRPTSLAELGYVGVGLDDNWQQCGSYGASQYTYHSEEGRPLVNRARFPDLIAMTNKAHALNLTAGWYLNNCICADHCATEACYQGDVDALLDYGFDSVKLDGCGAQLDLERYAALLSAAGAAATLVENCHWGQTVPNATWCPFNYYRTSGDVRASYASVVANLQSTRRWADGGLSRPGCWAYPDMLELGCAHGPGGASDPGLSDDEAQAHFGAWCVVSSPLILSHDMTNASVMDALWPLITNVDALGINQAWYGSSGTLVLEAQARVKLADAAAAADVPAWQVFAKPLDEAQVAILLMNHGEEEATISVPFAAVPGLDPQSLSDFDVYDVWAQKDLPGRATKAWAATLRSHQSAFVVVTPSIDGDASKKLGKAKQRTWRPSGWR